jgi:DNA-binding MarR family transcriptional regulator
MASTGTEPLMPEETAAWEGLLYTHAAVMRTLDSEFEERHRLSLRTYDVLATIEESSDERLRMSELAANILLSPSRLTRVVQRLERDGLVARDPDEHDARVIWASLTAEGMRQFGEAQVTHHEVIRAQFLGRLSSSELRLLGAVWRKSLAGARYAELLEEHIRAAE